jgi:hypothetical protein
MPGSVTFFLYYTKLLTVWLEMCFMFSKTSVDQSKSGSTLFLKK